MAVLTTSGHHPAATSAAWGTTRSGLAILANAAAIELYFLCVEDEQNADKCCSKCSEKFHVNLSPSETIAQAPLIASCVQVMMTMNI